MVMWDVRTNDERVLLLDLLYEFAFVYNCTKQPLLLLGFVNVDRKH